MIWCGDPPAGPSVSIPRREESVERVDGEEMEGVLGSGNGCAAIVWRTVLSRNIMRLRE